MSVGELVDCSWPCWLTNCAVSPITPPGEKAAPAELVTRLSKRPVAPLKPTVLTLAMLLEMTESVLLCASSPDTPANNAPYKLIKLSS